MARQSHDSSFGNSKQKYIINAAQPYISTISSLFLAIRIMDSFFAINHNEVVFHSEPFSISKPDLFWIFFSKSAMPFLSVCDNDRKRPNNWASMSASQPLKQSQRTQVHRQTHASLGYSAPTSSSSQTGNMSRQIRLTTIQLYDITWFFCCTWQCPFLITGHNLDRKM